MRERPLGHHATIALALLLAGLHAPTAWAHPADMYAQTQVIEMTLDGIRVQWTLSPGYLLTQQVWSFADANRDYTVGPEEARAWVATRIANLSIALDSVTPAPLTLGPVEWPSTFDSLRLGDEVVRATLTGNWPSDRPPRHLTVHNRWEEVASLNWFSVRGMEGVSFHSPEQQNGRLELDFVLPARGPTDASSPQPPEKDLKKYWDSGTPSFQTIAEVIGLADAQEVAAQTPASRPQPDPRPTAMLTRFIRRPDLSPTFYLIALATAVMLGALHALAPGHGKSIVAAYLVGSRGTVKHAVFLGAIVTLTHTGSVFALGVIALVLSQYVLPTSLFPWLELASGLLIVILGGWLLCRRWRPRREDATPASHTHDHDHPHNHEHSHGEGQHHHHAPDPAEVTWRSMLLLGISGGLVPCPDAIAILLIAIAVNRIVLGLSLILAFSLGLALVLIAIGIAMVQSRRLLDRMDAFKRVMPVLPALSALVILALGAGLAFSAVRNTGLLGGSVSGAGIAEAPFATGKLPVPPPSAVRPPAGTPGTAPSAAQGARFLCLIPDETSLSQLCLVPVGGGQHVTLTHEPLGVLDYALSPDGTTVAYSALGKDNRYAIWSIQTEGRNRRKLVSASLGMMCKGLAWAPDGSLLMYERLDTLGTVVSQLPSLWWLKPPTRETGPLFEDRLLPGSAASWSPDGAWLSYASSVTRGTEVRNLKDGRGQAIPGWTTDAATWHPQQNTLVVMVRPLEQKPYDRLLRFEPETGESEYLGDEENVEYACVSWSPDGAWLAIARTDSPGLNKTPGSRIWLMRPDGGDVRPLTDVLEVSPCALAWSDDAARLLFEASSSQQGEIWMVDVETGKTDRVAASGTSPIWLD